MLRFSLAVALKRIALFTTGLGLQLAVSYAYGQFWGCYDPYGRTSFRLATAALGRWGWLPEDMLVVMACLILPFIVRKRWPMAARLIAYGILAGFLLSAHYFIFVDPESSVYGGDYR